MPAQNPDILKLLRSNFGTYTGEIDVKHACRCLQDSELEAKSYEAEINRLEMKIIALRNRQSIAYRRSEQYRSLLAPIRRLPPELLSHILSFCCPRNVIAFAGTEYPAICLSHVCAGWRELARTTSSLWSSISVFAFDNGTMPLRKREAFKEAVDLHLQLSRQAPLSLILSMRKDAEFERGILKSICAHSSRWETLSIRLTWDLLTSNDFAHTKHKLPLLRSLDIESLAEMRTTSLDAFQDAPLLTDVIIRNHKAPGMALSLPFSQLTSLTFNDCWVSGALRLINSATQVQHITFGVGCTENVGGLPEGTPVLVPSQRLAVVTGAGLSIPDVFKYLTLPGLAHLSISSPFLRPCLCTNVRRSAISSLLSRARCTLTTLVLDNVEIQDHDLVALLQLQPLNSLTTLIIHEPRTPVTPEKTNLALTQSFFEGITVNYRGSLSSTLLPHLKELDLRFRAVDTFPWPVLLSMIHSRWIPDAEFSSEIGVDSLTSVILRPLGDVKASDMQPLQVLKAAGLLHVM
ncbi:hypothetical protein D9758_011410 [Tetrapyrgos nigripes]|uniref:F-box domain-containing protein n=1 Tax=Tetrapyrgos nigripes TaxID=182062 RepID=A0A8H5CQA9_9AGAR|nr:hypothetical protein D9758_011410 [Tetrapyrgos nigripes]